MESGIETRAEFAILPFRIVEELGLACGYERSFKLMEGNIYANRYLLGIDIAGVPHRDLLGICRRLDMPTTHIDLFRRNLAHANLVFLGFEDNETRCMYKIYLEFFGKLEKDIQNKKDKKKPALLHLGFKWQADNNAIRTISEYMCYPLLSADEILSRMAEIYDGAHQRESFGVATDIVKLAAARSAAKSFLYVEVSEHNNARQSFDINLYNAGLRLEDIYPLIERACGSYNISVDKIDRLYAMDGRKFLGHLSGGVNRDAADFLTVYYEG